MILISKKSARFLSRFQEERRKTQRGAHRRGMMGMQAAGWMDSFVLPQHDGVSSTFASSPSSLFSRKFPLFSVHLASSIPLTNRHGAAKRVCSSRARKSSDGRGRDANALRISRGNENFPVDLDCGQVRAPRFWPVKDFSKNGK